LAIGSGASFVSAKTEKAESGINSAFYESVILLDDIIEIFALA